MRTFSMSVRDLPGSDLSRRFDERRREALRIAELPKNTALDAGDVVFGQAFAPSRFGDVTVQAHPEGPHRDREKLFAPLKSHPGLLAELLRGMAPDERAVS